MRRFGCLHIKFLFFIFMAAGLPVNGMGWSWFAKKRQYSKLSADEPCKIVNLLSAEEIAILATIQVKSSNIQGVHFFDKGCGPKGFKGFLQDIENPDQVKDAVVPILSKMADEIFHNQFEIMPESCLNWSMVVVENEVNHDRSGWHLDVLDKACKQEDTSMRSSHRIIASIIGQGTLYTNHKPDKEFLHYYCQDSAVGNSDIVRIIDDMIPIDSRIQLQPGQAMFFDKNYAIHSRPFTTEPRVFMVLDFKKKWWV